MDVTAWLQGLGLERYEALFREHEIDWEVLPKLTSEDLKEIGVQAIGHRRKLLEAIASLDPKVLTATESSATLGMRGQVEAERRQLTVIFCDLVGSTTLSARLDPEDLRDVIAAYHHAVADTVRSFDGFVAKYMGDGVLIYFGYPRAHEDDAERAVRAGLSIIDVVSRLDVETGKLQARIGIATGLVVVGDLIGEGSAQEQSVVGETPNLAARLQVLAEPDAVVIAAGTRQLVGDLFEYRDLGLVKVKGIAAPVPAWQVLRPSPIESRFEALRGAALTSLIGRDEEIELLMRRWTRAKEGDGQVVLISGEPGIGKSRMTAALAERLQSQPHRRLRYFCSPYHQDSALFPFVDQLSRAAGFANDDNPSAKLEKLDALLSRAQPPQDDVALLADLLSLPASEFHPLPELSPRGKKDRTVTALIRQLDGLARQEPVLIVFEDVHWIDPTSLELLDLAVEHLRSLPVLLIMTFRPEFQPPWVGEPQVTLVALSRLVRRDRIRLIEEIVGNKTLPDKIVDQIADRADGVPLFVEELTKNVLESGMLREEVDRYVLDGDFRPLAIPANLHDSLVARLDRFASARLVAQVGAAIGREFSYAMVCTVSRLPDDDVQFALGRLVADGLIFQRGEPPEAVYIFKHALVQDAAHGTLLRSTRQQLHAQIAEALRTQLPEMIENQPEIFARHYAEAGLVEQSVACWVEAGRRSVTRLAMAEAAAQFQQGLDQLSLLPKNTEHQRKKLELLSALGDVQQAVKGFAATETGDAYARARELWEELGSPSEFLRIPFGQSYYYTYRGDLNAALRVDEDLLSLSRNRNDVTGLVLGYLCAGRTLMLTGRFESSRLNLETGLTLYDPVSHGPLFHQSGVHPHVNLLAFLGNVLFCLGFPARAMARTNAAVMEARRLAHPPSLAVSLNVGCRLISLMENDALLGEWAGELLAMAKQQGFSQWHAFGTVYSGWYEVKTGNVSDGIALIRSGLAAYQATGAAQWMPYQLGLLAKACVAAGDVEEGLALLDDALRIVARTGERWLDAELNRQKGAVLLRQGQSDAAEQLYRDALHIAEEQGAKLWELRAAMSLAKLRCDQGRLAEAYNLVAPVYSWFTEGFDTLDLAEARTLLTKLSETPSAA